MPKNWVGRTTLKEEKMGDALLIELFGSLSGCFVSGRTPDSLSYVMHKIEKKEIIIGSSGSGCSGT